MGGSIAPCHCVQLDRCVRCVITYRACRLALCENYALTDSLRGTTGIAGLITMYAMGDMMIYNRRKRNEWYIDQEQRRAKALVLAREAAAQGTANENQILLLNQERAAEEAEEERRGKRGIFKRVKQMFYAGLSIEEHSFRTIPGGGEGTEETQAQVESGPPSDNAGSSIVAAVEDIKGKVSGPTVGPLDRLAADVAQAGTTGSRSWSSWAKGR